MPKLSIPIYLLQKGNEKNLQKAKNFSNIAKTSSNEFRRKKLQVPA